MQEFVEFCQDEFWDLDVRGGKSHSVCLMIRKEDPRRDRFLVFLQEVQDWVGIEFIDHSDQWIIATFDKCGAEWPSMVFRVRSSFANPVHIDAAKRRDVKDWTGILDLYASQGRKFKRGFVHPSIRLLQRGLMAHGYETPQDGKWGWKTRLQLWRFRRRHGIWTPPFIDSKTIKALEV